MGGCQQWKSSQTNRSYAPMSYKKDDFELGPRCVLEFG